MLSKCLLAAGVAAALIADRAAAEPVPAPTVTIDANQTGPVISRDIFGQFAEQLGNGIYGGVWVGRDSPIANVRGIRSDVVAALRALHVPNVRWPGGCFADQYHWRNGIGPADKRRVTYNINWGDPVEPNQFGTHEYLDFIDQIGAEANITANVGSGSVQEAADWLEYLTTDKPTTLAQERAANGRPAPWRIKFFAYGNESWGCGGPMSAEAYVERLKIYANFVRNLNPAQNGLSRLMPGPDPMKRIAVGPADGDTAYTEAVMKAWAESSPRDRPFDALSLHHYTAGPLGAMRDKAEGFGEADYAAFVGNTYGMDALIAKHAAIMDKYDPARKVALSVDEWGVWVQPMAGTPFLYLRQQGTMRDAIVAALHLNIFARHANRVRMANIAQMVNVLQAMILTDGPKMLLTPTYHVFRLYVPFQDAQDIPITVTAGDYNFGGVAVSRVDAIAARAKDGKGWLALTNIDPHQSVDISAVVRGVAAKSAVGEVLTAPRVDAANSFAAPSAVAPRPVRMQASGGKLMLHLPLMSVTVVQIEE